MMPMLKSEVTAVVPGKDWSEKGELTNRANLTILFQIKHLDDI